MAGGDVYAERYGMTGRPFDPQPDPSMLVWLPGTVRAAAAVEYAVTSGASFGALTGLPGTGKTSLILRAMAELAAPPSEDGRSVGATFCLVRAAPRDGSIVPWILQALGIGDPAVTDPVDRFDLLQNALIESYAAGRKVVLCFDDAHHLTDAALHDLRMVASVNTAADVVVQVVLAGDERLSARLRAADNRGLAQRVGAWAGLPTIGRDAVGCYVGGRLDACGGAADLIDPACHDPLHRLTGGIPRAINHLCELALIQALSDGSRRVTDATLRAVVEGGMFLPCGDRATMPRPQAVETEARVAG